MARGKKDEVENNVHKGGEWKVGDNMYVEGFWVI